MGRRGDTRTRRVGESIGSAWITILRFANSPTRRVPVSPRPRVSVSPRPRALASPLTHSLPVLNSKILKQERIDIACLLDRLSGAACAVR